MGASDIAISRKQIGVETPMIATEITDNCVYTGLFGSIDSTRMAGVSERINTLADTTNAEYVIIDLSNVDAIDSAVAKQLSMLAETLSMVGLRAIFCGLKGMVARTMSVSGVSIAEYTCTRNLKAALSYLNALA